MTSSNDLLSKINHLKQASAEYAEKLQTAKARKAVLDDSLDKLTASLQEAVGTSDWDELDQFIAQAATEAQEAVERLQQALDEAGVSYE